MAFRRQTRDTYSLGLIVKWSSTHMHSSSYMKVHSNIPKGKAGMRLGLISSRNSLSIFHRCSSLWCCRDSLRVEISVKDHNASNCWLHRRHNSYRQLRLYNLNLSLVSYRLCLHILYRRCPTILGVYGLLVSAVGLHRMLAIDALILACICICSFTLRIFHFYWRITLDF